VERKEDDAMVVGKGVKGYEGTAKNLCWGTKIGEGGTGERGGGTWSWGQSHVTRGKAQVVGGRGRRGPTRREAGREVGLKGRGEKGRRGK
jgi:hypothetical protein